MLGRERLPKHIAIIPDGNRRWAKKTGLAVWFGHESGAKSSENIFKTANELGIYSLTFWGGSYDNLTKRPKIEIAFLGKVYKRNFEKLLETKEIFTDKVKVNIFGFWEKLLPANVKKPMQEIIEKTKNHRNRFLNFLIGYNGTLEMIEAVKKIVGRARQDKNLEVTSALIKENLWTCDLPPVDLVIRTGLAGDPHWSNGFMMWDTADSQYYFTATLWPEFTPEEFKKAIENYAQRERRMGA